MFYHFKYEPDERGGYFAQCLELENCHTEGDNLEELTGNMTEVLNLLLDEPDENIIYPLPLTEEAVKGSDIIKIKVEPNIALSLYFKHLRKKNNYTQKQVAEKLGYKSIWAYQKLERGKYSNVQLKTLTKIKEVYPEFDMNIIL
jgi:antitoxin HicB